MADNAEWMPHERRAADPAQSAPSAEQEEEICWSKWRASGPVWTRWGISSEREREIAKAYAALRTAQLERELRDYQDGIDNAMFINVPEYGFSSALPSRKRTVEFIAETLKFAQGQRETLKTRAETAESALRQFVSFLEIINARGGLGSDVHKRIEELLTVAAQTDLPKLRSFGSARS